MSALVNVVQFPHPGGEHIPGESDVMAWNSGRHQRKFLAGRGQWLDDRGVRHEGALTFWGEWEPPSRVTMRWPGNGLLPRFLHEPVLTELPNQMGLQNTDPLVFGDRFQYSNCKQLTNGHPSMLQELEPGSVLLFGSKEPGGSGFVLDTAFVVADGRPFVPTGLDLLPNEFVRRVVAEPLATFQDAANARFTLFAGATLKEPAHGMFSFVPCMPADNGPIRFARPPIELPGLINPKSQQSPKGFTQRDRVLIAQAKEAWESVIEQVRATGCQLAWQIEPPPFVAVV